MDTRDQLMSSASSYLRHLSTVIGQLDDAAYTQESRALPGSTIGKHVRHILDHFLLLLEALPPPEAKPASDAGPEQVLGPVNYAHRERNPDTESTVGGGQASITSMAERIGKAPRTIPQSIRIADTMPNGETGSFLSTVDRELWFCLHHMVHHNAIIASLMHELGAEPPREFAYAPSTIKHAHHQHQ